MSNLELASGGEDRRLTREEKERITKSPHYQVGLAALSFVMNLEVDEGVKRVFPKIAGYVEELDEAFSTYDPDDIGAEDSWFLKTMHKIMYFDLARLENPQVNSQELGVLDKQHIIDLFVKNQNGLLVTDYLVAVLIRVSGSNRDMDDFYDRHSFFTTNALAGNWFSRAVSHLEKKYMQDKKTVIFGEEVPVSVEDAEKFRRFLSSKEHLAAAIVLTRVAEAQLSKNEFEKVRKWFEGKLGVFNQDPAVVKTFNLQTAGYLGSDEEQRSDIKKQVVKALLSLVCYGYELAGEGVFEGLYLEKDEVIEILGSKGMEGLYLRLMDHLGSRVTNAKVTDASVSTFLDAIIFINDIKKNTAEKHQSLLRPKKGVR